MALKPFMTFCSESSIHGIPYFSNEDAHSVEKVFWGIVTIISFICCLMLVAEIGVKVQEDMTVTYTSDTSISATKISFPAVTICFDPLSYGNFSYSKYHVIKEQLENGEITVDSISEEDLKGLQAVCLILSDKFLLDYNASRIPTDDIFEYIDEITLPLRKLILTSTFSNAYATNFAKVIGPTGICYNFNMVESHKLYKNLDAAPKIFSYTHDILYFTRVRKYLRTPLISKKYNLTNPLNLTTADSNFEIRIAPKDKSMKYDLGSILNTYDHYTFASPHIYINSPYEMYSKDVNSYFSNRGKKLLYFIDPKQTMIHETLIDYGPDIRGCYFNADGVDHQEDERVLKYFKIYTKGNCKQECLINRTLEFCGCVQFFMIHDESTRVCGIHDMDCYQKVENELDSVEHCRCYPHCGEIIYHVERVQTDFIKPVVLDVWDSFLEMSKNDKYDSLTIVKFRTLSYFPYMLKRQFTGLDFIAYTGGAFGLFLGISIMSFVEVFYYFTIRILFSWMREKRKNRKVRGELSKILDKAKSKVSYVHFYFSISTIHGMSQIIMNKRNFIERMFWTLCLGFSLLYCVITSYEMYEKFEQSTVAITYDSDESSVENIPFPAIFITPEISIPHVIVRMAWNLKIMGVPDKFHFGYLRNFGMLNRYLVSALMCNYHFALDNIEKNGETGIDDFLSIIKKYSLNFWFKEQAAVWNDKFRPEFVEFLGSSGYGFSFNMFPPEKLYRENVSSDFSEVFRIVHFNISEISKDLVPLSYLTYPISAPSRSSLKLTLKKNKFIPYKNVCQTLFFSIHSPFEFPGEYDDDNSNKFYYGQNLDVYITPDVIRSEDDLRTLSIEKRNCYFEDEVQLKYFKIYTRSNCEMECLANYYLNLNQTQCVPFFIIRGENTTMCKIEQHQDTLVYKFNFLQNITFTYIGSGTHLDKCKCLDTCNDIQYNVEVTESKLVDEISADENATITITFKYKYDKYLPLVRRIAFSSVEFLCQAGGLLGLYAGISALSIVELMYFIIIRPITNLLKWIFRKIFKS